MKRLVLLFSVISAITLATASYARTQEGHEKKHEFGVRQYEQFHDVLHPLQHEALPNKDFRHIRTKSALLVSRGNAIVRLGTPRGVTAANKVEFAAELNKFRKAIARFKNDAKKRDDGKLEASFSAVHDSYEMLVAMLPRG